MLGAKKIALVPQMAQMPEPEEGEEKVPKNHLIDRLEGLFPSGRLVSVQCAQSALARNLAEWLGHVFETQFTPNAWLNAGAPRPPEKVDRELERLRSGADAVIVVADADVLRALALYYLREVRGVPYLSRLPEFGADETMVMDLGAGVFQTIRPLSPAR